MLAIVIDGNCLLYRCFYASLNQLEFYKSHNKQPLNVLKLFLLILAKTLHNKKYDYVAVAFDTKVKSFRHQELESYKQQRKPMPEDLVSQLPFIHDSLKKMNIVTLAKEGYEADDLIGSYANLMATNNVMVEIFSSDKDMLQLVNSKVNVILLKTGVSNIQEVNINNFSSIYHGLLPNQVVDFKAIAGDSSDNFAGVTGIGEKTTEVLLNKYHTLDGIYKNINELPEKQKEKFIKSKESAYICQKIATIQTNLLINTNIEIYKNNFNKNALRDIITMFHFSGFENYII